MSKQNEQRLYNINRLKQIVKILTGALIVFAGVTVLIICANLYKCEGTVYLYNENSSGVPEVKQWESLNAKITYLDFAIGLEHDDDSFIPVSKDIRFLFLYFSQIIAYALLFFLFFKQGKVKFIMLIVTALILIGIGIYSFIFFHNYRTDLQQMFDNAIETISANYKDSKNPNAEIIGLNGKTGSDDIFYEGSKINVTMSVVPFLSCAYMIVSGVMCVVLAYIGNLINKASNRGVTWTGKRN